MWKERKLENIAAVFALPDFLRGTGPLLLFYAFAGSSRSLVVRATYNRDMVP